jgi:hypothetical protein
LLGSVATAFLDSVATPPGKELPAQPTLYYTPLFENDNVRMSEYRLELGKSESMHEHSPMFVYSLEGEVVGISALDGLSFEESLAGVPL